jgi:hypothetical protein
LASAALLVSSFLLQGCTPMTDGGVSNPSESPIPAKPHRYNPILSPAFDEPWPTNVTRKEMIDTALFKSFEFLDSLPKGPCAIEVNTYFQDSWVQQQVDLVDSTSRRMVELFCDYMSEDIHIIGGNYDFVKETVAKENLWQDKFGGICGYDVKFDAGTACAAYNIAWVGQQVGTVRRGEFAPEPTRVTYVTHEIFHVVHDDIDSKPGPNIPGPFDPLFRPVWLVEGAGQYFGSIIPKYFDLQDYQTYLPYDRSGLFMEVSYLSNLKDMEVVQKRGGGSENYYTGLVAHEYIAASIGLEPLIEIWVLMDTGESFQQAFENVTGLSVEEFYQKFSEMHDNLYLGDLVE